MYQRAKIVINFYENVVWKTLTQWESKYWTPDYENVTITGHFSVNYLNENPT